MFMTVFTASEFVLLFFYVIFKLRFSLPSLLSVSSQRREEPQSESAHAQDAVDTSERDVTSHARVQTRHILIILKQEEASIRK